MVSSYLAVTIFASTHLKPPRACCNLPPVTRPRPIHLVSLFALTSLLCVSAREARAEVNWNIRLEGGVAGPLNDPQKRLFDLGVDSQLRLSLEATSFFDIYANGGFLGLSPDDSNPNRDWGTAWNLGGGIRFKRPYKEGIVSPWIDGDLGWYRTDNQNRMGFSVGAGLHFAVGESRRFRLGPYVRYAQIIQRESDTTAGFDDRDARILMGGLSLEFGGQPKMAPKDRDGDGIVDPQDKCPNEAEDRDGFQDTDGCPDPDNDGDGLLDANDKCPNEAEDKDGFEDDDGCPEVDNDGDGIADVNDACPLQPEDKDGFQDEDGCPDVDNDSDGVPDADDLCPNVAGLPGTNGCPDRDHDTIDDQHDDCPDVPGLPENRGCPVYKKVKVSGTRIEISEKIFFSFGKAKILPKSYPVLNEVTKVLKDNPTLKVRVEGHSDSKGNAATNKKLSRDRAVAVRDYLVTAGIDASRLDAEGYGSEQPLESNNTAAGREKNRRVEFVIMNQQGAQ